MDPHRTPLSSHPNAPPLDSSFISPYPHAIPAQTVSQQRRQEQQLQHNHLPHSLPNTHQNSIYNETLSAEQRAAVTIFHAFPNPTTIFTYLESFRSYLCGEQGFYPSDLSPQQCQAFFDLTGFPNETVLTLLHAAQSPSNLVSSQPFHDGSIFHSGRVAADSLAQSPSSISNATISSTPRSHCDEGPCNLSRDDFVGLPSSSAASSNKHVRWCFLCEDTPRSFTTLDGFKRHLREHYTRYYCIPQCSVMYTEDGPRCAFCDKSNPDVIHLNTHQKGCVGRKYPRRGALIYHQKKEHGVQDSSMLADQSEHNIGKKYFACGFCVFCCGSLNEQANHIDAAHYRFSQHISHWDQDKVIRGLLSQPVVNECWRRVLAANPHLQESRFKWNPTLVKQLQHRLEMSREPAEILCNAAIDASNYSRSQHGHFESMLATDLTNQEMTTDQSIQTFQSRDALSPLSYNSGQSYTSHSPYSESSTLQSQNLARGWNDHTVRAESRPFFQIASGTSGQPASDSYQHADHRARLFNQQSTAESLMQHQHTGWLSPTPSASGTSCALGGQARTSHSPNLGEHSLRYPPNFATIPRSRQEVDMDPAPTQAYASRSYPTTAIQSASSPLSPYQGISPPRHLSHTYGPRNYLAPTSQFSRQEPTNNRASDMDSNSGDQQRTQARGRSRRQRR